MQFRDFIHSRNIRGDLVSTEKVGVLAEMVDALIESGSLSGDLRQSVLTALIDRENLASTGLNDGIAIPHAKHPGIKKLTGLLARSREGIEYGSLDGQPAQLFFLLLSNQESQAHHLQALAYISKALRDDIFPKFLLRARDEKEMAELLEEADQKAMTGG